MNDITKEAAIAALAITVGTLAGFAFGLAVCMLLDRLGRW